MSDKPGQIKPGEVRNPNGRPKRHDSLAEIIRNYGIKHHKEEKRSRWEKLTDAMFNEAFDGNVKAAEWLANRAFGRTPLINNDVNGDTGPIIIQVAGWQQQKPKDADNQTT